MKPTTLILTTILLLTGCQNSSEGDSSPQEVTAQSVEATQMVEQESAPTVETNTTATIESNRTLSYHEVFKEPEAPQTTMERIVEQQEVEKLDRESKELLIETDELVIDEDLKLLDEDELNIPMDLDDNLSDKIKVLEKKLEKLEKSQADKGE